MRVTVTSKHMHLIVAKHTLTDSNDFCEDSLSL